MLTALVTAEPWQVPSGVEVNIKPLGNEVGIALDDQDLWMSQQVISEVEPDNLDKIADIKYLTEFTEIQTQWLIEAIPGTNKV